MGVNTKAALVRDLFMATHVVPLNKDFERLFPCPGVCRRGDLSAGKLGQAAHTRKAAGCCLVSRLAPRMVKYTRSK